MNRELQDLLRDKRFDELLARLDDPGAREGLVVALSRDHEAAAADEEDALDAYQSGDAVRVWDAVAAGQGQAETDEISATSAELAKALGAGPRSVSWFSRLAWGQMATSAGLAALLLLSVQQFGGGLGVSEQSYPPGQFVALARQQVLPQIAGDTSYQLVAGTLEQWTSPDFALKGESSENLASSELIKLLLIYRPSEKEVAELSQLLQEGHQGKAPEDGTE